MSGHVVEIDGRLNYVIDVEISPPATATPSTPQPDDRCQCKRWATSCTARMTQEDLLCTGCRGGNCSWAHPYKLLLYSAG